VLLRVVHSNPTIVAACRIDTIWQAFKRRKLKASIRTY